MNAVFRAPLPGLSRRWASRPNSKLMAPPEACPPQDGVTFAMNPSGVDGAGSKPNETDRPRLDGVDGPVPQPVLQRAAGALHQRVALSFADPVDQRLVAGAQGSGLLPGWWAAWRQAAFW